MRGRRGWHCAWGRALVYLPGTGPPAEMVCQAVAPGSSFMARAKSWRDIRQGRARSRKEWGRPRSPRPRARGGLLTHLGLQHLQSLGQLRHFAAVETTCGEGKAGAKARGPGPLRGLTLRGERYLTILIYGGAVWGWAAESLQAQVDYTPWGSFYSRSLQNGTILSAQALGPWVWWSQHPNGQHQSQRQEILLFPTG